MLQTSCILMTVAIMLEAGVWFTWQQINDAHKASYFNKLKYTSFAALMTFVISLMLLVSYLIG